MTLEHDVTSLGYEGLAFDLNLRGKVKGHADIPKNHTWDCRAPGVKGGVKAATQR